MHLANHGAVLIVGLVNVARHFLYPLHRQRRRLFHHLLLQLSDAVLKTVFLSGRWSEQAGLNAGVFFLMVDHQQGFSQIEAVIRAAVTLFRFRQIFETGNQVVSKQPAKEHRFAFLCRHGDKILQQAEGIENGKRAEPRVFVQQLADRREMQNAHVRLALVFYARRQCGVQQWQQRCTIL